MRLLRGRQDPTSLLCGTPYRGPMENVAVPLTARVQLAHAAVQVIADEAGIDVLHIKGPAVAPGLREHQWGSDVDIIVRPEQVAGLLRSLRSHGWSLETPFTSSSLFDHAANLRHSTWGLVDVHRSYPGIGPDPVTAFEVLWADRGAATIAAIPVPVPSRVAQQLILLLHAARTPGVSEHPDVTRNWTGASAPERAEIEALAARLDAATGLAAARGDLASVADDPAAALWASAQDPGNRVAQWRARLAAARGPADKVLVVWRAARVDRAYLAHQLGHRPTRADIAREWGRRARRATESLRRRGGSS